MRRNPFDELLHGLQHLGWITVIAYAALYVGMFVVIVMPRWSSL